MGIKDLTVFLKEFAPQCITKGNLSHITNKSSLDRKMRAAIDTSLFLYKYKYRSGDNFITEFLEQINRLLINNIEPIYVFDGAPPSEKKDTINIRKERKNSYLNKIKELEEQYNQINSNQNNLPNDENDTKMNKQAILDEITKIRRKTISITSEDTAKLKYFLDIMNIKYIKKNMEADIICSKLSSEGIVDFVISEDMDHLTSGTKILLRDFNNKNNYVTIYNLDIALKTLNITHDKWIELCILFGCDYVSRIKGLGYKTSYKYISKHKEDTFENILNIILQNKKFVLPENYLEKVSKAKTIFENNIDMSDLEEFCSKNDVFENQADVIKNYLKKYTQFSEQKIKNRIKNILGYCI